MLQFSFLPSRFELSLNVIVHLLGGYCSVERIDWEGTSHVPGRSMFALSLSYDLLHSDWFPLDNAFIE